MSATTVDRPAPVTLAGPVTAARVGRSRWTKFRSLRSTWWSLGTAVVLTVGLGLLVATQNTDGGSASISLIGTTFAALVLAVLGVLVISGEYGTGMIRASLTAVPKRLPVLWAKLAVYAVVVLPLTLVTSLVTFLGAEAIWSSRGMATQNLGDPGVVRSVVGAALYLTVSGLIAIAIGALVRHTAAGVAAVLGLYFVAPIVFVLLPSSLQGIGPYLPSNAGGALWGQTMTDHPLAPWTGFGVLCAYAVVLIGAALWRLRHTDA